ncbi:MAG: zinc-binding dehydrogenase [Candidatus Bathyarchaeia archaeon]
MNDLMIAARMHRIGDRLTIDRVEIPSVTSQDVLVKVRASGICHSDLNYRGGIAPVGRLPITLGHEIAGIVEKKGKKVSELFEGDRVLVHYIISCKRCRYCKTGLENYCSEYQMIGKDVDGGFAEYVRVPANSIVKLPKTIPFEQAAIMGCAVATAYHALRRGRVRRRDVVMIIGVGGLGMHAVQLASKIFKAGLVIAVDLVDWKLKMSKSFGSSEVVNVSNQNLTDVVAKITDGKFADVVLDFVGHKSTIDNGITCLGKGGRMVLVGIGAKSMKVSPYSTIIGREIEIVGVDDHLKTELLELVRLVRSGGLDLSRSVTHRVGLEDVNHGFEILESGREHVVRVVTVNEHA